MKLNIKNFQKKALLVTSIIALLMSAVPATATTAWVHGHIQRTLVDVNYGGCMVILSDNVQDVLPECGAHWISLDCDAVYHTQAQSNALWSSALVGLSLQNKVQIIVDDTKKFNGFCVGMRLDMQH